MQKRVDKVGEAETYYYFEMYTFPTFCLFDCLNFLGLILPNSTIQELHAQFYAKAFLYSFTYFKF